MDNSIFVERDNNYVLEEEVPILDRLDIIENKMKLLENKINKCCESSNISPRLHSIYTGRSTPRSGRTSPYSIMDPYLDAMERSGDRVFLPQRKKAGKRKTRKNKNKRKNKKIRTRRYKK